MPKACNDKFAFTKKHIAEIATLYFSTLNTGDRNRFTATLLSTFFGELAPLKSEAHAFSQSSLPKTV